MPIKGISDRGMSFPELGVIRKGAPKGENRPGKDLEYFRMEFVDNDAEETFRAKYGEKPAELDVVLPFDRLEQFWEAWLEAYTAGRMVARADGENFEYWVDTATGEARVLNGKDVKTGEKVPYKDGQEVGRDNKNKLIKCEYVGRLKVVLPALGRFGYFTLNTTSVHDIINLSGQLEGIQQINNGHIAGVPLILRRRPKEISTPDPSDPKKRVRRTKWLLSIEADPEWARAKISQMKASLLPGNGYHDGPSNLLPDPHDLPPAVTSQDTEEGEYIEIIEEGEFEDSEPEIEDPENNPTLPPEPIVPPEPEPAAVAEGSTSFKPPKIPAGPKDHTTLYTGWMPMFSREDIALIVASSNDNAQIAHTKLLAQFKRLERTG